MVAKNYDRCFEHVLGSEGGFQDDPRDRGNFASCECGVGPCTGTNWGVSSCAYPDIAPHMKELTQDDAKAIYRVDYWNRVLADELPWGVDLCTFDGAINSGVSRGAKWLQEAVGVPQDGIVGPVTLAAVWEDDDHHGTVDAMCDARLSYLQGLSTWDTYGKGWTNRVASVREEAHEMIDDHKGISPDVKVVKVTASVPAGVEVEFFIEDE